MLVSRMLALTVCITATIQIQNVTWDKSFTRVLHGLVPKDTVVHILCLSRVFSSRHEWIYHVNFTVHHQCGQWADYIRLLKNNVAHNIKTSAVIPSSIVNRELLSNLNADMFYFPLVTWIILSDEKFSPKIFRRVPQLSCACVVVTKSKSDYVVDVPVDNFHYCHQRRSLQLDDLRLQPTEKPLISGLSRRSIRIASHFTAKGVVTDYSQVTEQVGVLQALRVLNVSIHNVTNVTQEWLSFVTTKKVDIMLISVAYTPERFGTLYFPDVLHYNQLVFFTPKRRSEESTVSLLVDMFLNSTVVVVVVVVSLTVCLVVLGLLSRDRKKSLSNTMCHSLLVLIACILRLTADISKEQRQSTKYRLVLIAWSIACFSVSAVFTSLLTSALSAGPQWEADDTFDKIRSAGESGRVAPCVERHSYAKTLLRMSRNQSSLLGVLSRALREPPDGVTCPSLVARKTHIFFATTDVMDHCDQLRTVKFK